MERQYLQQKYEGFYIKWLAVIYARTGTLPASNHSQTKNFLSQFCFLFWKYFFFPSVHSVAFKWDFSYENFYFYPIPEHLYTFSTHIILQKTTP